MFGSLSLVHRRRAPEVMDQPGLGKHEHFGALRGLARLNRLSGSARVLWPAIRAAAQTGPRPLRVLDLASGGGDVTIGLWSHARREGLDIEVQGCDVSETAVEYAAEQARLAQADVQFRRLDVLNEPLPQDFDVVCCSLFLHHLADEEAVELLRRMGRAARRLVLINDLVRNLATFVVVYLSSRLATGSRVVHVDGPRSVEAAFTVGEARELATRAGLTGATVQRRYPCRWLMTWKR